MRQKRPNLTTRVLLGVNLALVIVLGTFMVRDYYAAWDTFTLEKRNDLKDQADILLTSVLRIQRQGESALRDFVNESCRAIPESTSPGHHLVVRIGSKIYQPQIYAQEPPAVFSAIQRASAAKNGLAPLKHEIMAAARAQKGDTVVYVSEYLSNLQRIGRTLILRRIIAILLVGIVLGLVLNVMLRRLIDRPLREMIDVVIRFGRGETSARMSNVPTLELGLLADEFNRMAGTIQQAQIERGLRMEKARQIQKNLLPDLTAIVGAKLACLFQPATEIAGDFYDVIRCPRQVLLFFLADVTGHDVPAAMGAAMLKALLLSACGHEEDPKKLVYRVHKAFARVTLDGDFATVILARWDPASRLLKYTNAGHEDAFLIPFQGEIQELAPTGPLLGVPELDQWSDKEILMAPGDRLVLLSDGYRETFSPQGKIFGKERLLESLEKTRADPLETVPEKLMEILKSHRGSAPQTDDITALIVEF